jgi:hypothetical protein
MQILLLNGMTDYFVRHLSICDNLYHLYKFTNAAATSKILISLFKCNLFLSLYSQYNK